LEIRSRRSTNIDSPRGPETPRRLRPNDVTMISSAMAKVTPALASVRALMFGWSSSSTTTQTHTKTMNQGSDRGPSHRLPMNIGSNRVVNGMKLG